MNNMPTFHGCVLVITIPILLLVAVTYLGVCIEKGVCP